MSDYIKIKTDDKLYKFEISAGQQVNSDDLLSEVDTSNFDAFSEVNITDINSENILPLIPPHIEQKNETCVPHEPKNNNDPSVLGAYLSNAESYTCESTMEQIRRCAWETYFPEEKNIIQKTKPAVAIAKFKTPITDAAGNILSVSEAIIEKSNTMRQLGEALIPFSVDVPAFEFVNSSVKFSLRASRGFLIFARFMPWVGLALTTYDIVNFGMCMAKGKQKIPAKPSDYGMTADDFWNGFRF